MSDATGPGSVDLSVGMLSANLHEYGRDLRRLEQAGAYALHFDIMDGRFCPDLTVGTWFVSAIETTLVKDVHLLVADPENWVEACVRAGAGILTPHLEAGRHVHRALEIVAEVSDEATRPLRGIGICPGTPVPALEPFLDVLDIVYVLGINPGWRQPMLPTTAARVRAVRELVAQADHPIRVAVDGGVSLGNFEEVVGFGPDLVVSGSAVFSGGVVAENLRAFASRGARLR